MSNTYLSKSKLTALHQCPLRLWNEVHRREEMQEPSDEAQSRFDMGTKVGELARGLFPKGKLIDAEYYEPTLALEQTKRALFDESIPALFEPAFEYRQTRVRCDLLVRGKRGWQLWEVKSVVNPKEYHILDVAIQAHTMRNSLEADGFHCDFENIGVVHLNSEYMYDGKEYDVNSLFRRYECLEDALDLEVPVEDLITEGAEIIESTKPPHVEPGNQCYDPYECPFLGSTCTIPAQHELTTVPGIGPAKLERLIEQGITTLDELAASAISLNGAQNRMLRARESGKAVVEPTLAAELVGIGYPRFYLDFETFASALPRYKGTRPFQTIAFQHSIHFESSEGAEVEHFGYLHGEDTDPRQALVDHMLSALELHPKAPVLMYTHYEKRVLNELAVALPDFAERIHDVIKRLVDLCAIIRDNVYHPDFNGSFSIKDVLPALVPELGYDDLEIADGNTASIRYLEMIELAKTDSDAARVVWEQLWAYCKRDTEAMVAVIEWLQRDHISTQ